MFEEFHRKRNYEIFQDIYNEMELAAALKVAEKLAREMYEQAQMNYLTQVFEEKSYREEYIKNIQQTLNVSQRKSKLLYSKIRNQVKKQLTQLHRDFLINVHQLV